jgi:type II secretory pathway pseudopilin PulG
MIRTISRGNTRIPTLTRLWSTVGATLCEPRKVASGNGSLMEFESENLTETLSSIQLEDPSVFDIVLLNESPRSSTMRPEPTQDRPGNSDSGDFPCRADSLRPHSRTGSRPNRKRASTVGFTLLETLIAFLISTIGVNVIYNSLHNVGRNSLDTMNRQGAASAMESAHEAVKRINNVSDWIRLDTSWIDIEQGVPFRVEVTGAPVDSNSTTSNCVKPGAASLLLAKINYRVVRNTTDPNLSRDSLVASTILSQQ